jgi:imidazolonepropionase-like amidohydrolase
MLRPLRWLLALGVLVSTTRAEAQRARNLAITGVTVITGDGTVLRNHTILIADSIIVAVAPAASVSPPAGAQVIDGRGKFVVPGFIDAHVHLATEPDGEDSRPRTELRLAAALHGGVTTVRDMAGDTRALAPLARDARSGAIVSPDIYYVALFAGPEFFRDPRTQSSSRGETAGAVAWMRAVSDTTDFQTAVRQAKATGATAIKLYALLDSTASARAVAEAHRQGMRVWAHAALRPATSGQLAGAGVDAVSHASLLAQALPPAARTTFGTSAAPSAVFDSVLRVMAARHVVFDPTLFISQRTPAAIALAGAVTRRAREMGVPVAAGTDSIAAADERAVPNIHTEMELLVTQAGFTPGDAIVAATRNGALAIGLTDRGIVARGLRADLVLLRADPTVDIRNTRQIEMVVKCGEILRR